ncbi:MAG: hypothetical protein OYH77_00615 [Pseudomonadota bacterium]|nr:hypothetical protein [Pseudomonadota bacterium]
MFRIVAITMLLLSGAVNAESYTGKGTWEEVQQDAEEQGVVGYKFSSPRRGGSFAIELSFAGDFCSSIMWRECSPFIAISGEVFFEYNYGYGNTRVGGIFSERYEELIGWAKCSSNECKMTIKKDRGWVVVKFTDDEQGNVTSISGMVSGYLDPDEYYVTWSSESVD